MLPSSSAMLITTQWEDTEYVIQYRLQSVYFVKQQQQKTQRIHEMKSVYMTSRKDWFVCHDENNPDHIFNLKRQWFEINPGHSDKSDVIDIH